VRVTEALLPGDRPASRKQLKRARAAVRETLAGHDVLTGAGRIVAMGGAVRNLASAALRTRRGVPDSVQGGTLAITDLRDLIAALARRAPRRRALAGIKSARADIILGAALVLEMVLETTGADALEVTRAGLREGVFFADRLLAGAPPLIADVRSHAVRNLVAQHADDVQRAERVAELALQLHDSALQAGAIKPARDERQLLWTAAMAHDIGTAVDCDGSGGHARYVLLNCELFGFTPREVALVAQIVRYQRKGTPGLDDARSLARPGDHELVARCALLLRLATHLMPCGDIAVDRARFVAEGDKLRVRFGHDDHLVRWALARAVGDDAFRPVFKRRLVAG
jgi:exopolyphosphatase/guanosine-5'-triphosphate,3'-diphosphate pyrophosphatase